MTWKFVVVSGLVRVLEAVSAPAGEVLAVVSREVVRPFLTEPSLGPSGGFLPAVVVLLVLVVAVADPAPVRSGDCCQPCSRNRRALVVLALGRDVNDATITDVDSPVSVKSSIKFDEVAPSGFPDQVVG